MSTGEHKCNRESRDLFVQNKLGLHARPASMFVKLATKFKSEIFVIKDGEEVNGKSIMGLMMLAAAPANLLPFVLKVMMQNKPSMNWNSSLSGILRRNRNV